MPVYRFGPFEFDPESGDLGRGGEVTRLRQQPAALLAALLDRNGRVLTRAEISSLLWPDEVHVDIDSGINFVVRQLRKSLGDDATGPALIETLPRRGYRLIVPVERAGVAAPPIARRETNRIGLVAAALAGAAIVMVVVMNAQPRPQPLRLLVEIGTDEAGARFFDGQALREMIVADLTASGSMLDVIAPAIADDYLYTPFPETRRLLSLDLLLHVSVRDGGGYPLMHAKLVRAADGAVLWSVNRDYQPDAFRSDARSIAHSIGTIVPNLCAERSCRTIVPNDSQ